MHSFQRLQGVFAAAVTPITADYTVDLESLPHFLSFLAKRGCHGALLLGTTGEGPSFSREERIDIFRSAARVREEHPDFVLLAGTGTPSLGESIWLTRSAFGLGFDGVVVLPPYFYRKAGDEGLLSWYSKLIESAVPSGGALLGYHIPPVSGVALSLDLLDRLLDRFPNQFGGIKDSSSDPEHARILGKRFGPDMVVFNGNDSLFSLALDNHASGCITALANLLSEDLRRLWDSHKQGQVESNVQEKLNQARAVMDLYQPAPPFLKCILSELDIFPKWQVYPPLIPFEEDIIKRAVSEYLSAVE
jgi:4-hydroxy-tetrahydrodipicolinate synthase